MTGTFSVKTLGCKYNQYESALIASALSSAGWKAVPFGESADIVIVNTCTVTDSADKKCRNYIRQGARFSSSGGVIVVGCMPKRQGSRINEMREIIASVDNADREHLVENILSAAGFTPDGKTGFSEEDSQPYGRVRSFIRVQDGCDGECSYCIVPSVRGKPVSRPFDEVIRHAEKSVAGGAHELVLTGITIGKYSSEGRDLADLAESLMRINGDFRIRITSIEPRHMTEKLASLYANPKLAPHSHLPLQSGSDRILEMMKRPYNREEYFESVRLLRSIRPDLAIGTDIIVGFPGESDDDFAQTLSAVREAAFSYVHQFTYSSRSGTPSSMIRECDPDTVTERSASLRKISADCAEKYSRSFIGKTDMAVIEREGEGVAARTGHYLLLPVSAESSVCPGTFCTVSVIEQNGILTAVPLPSFFKE